MPISKEQAQPYIDVLERLYENATYSAQAYFEATKSAEFWGKTIVFVPAVASAVSGILTAFGFDKSWGAVSAVAGVIAATGSFLGAERKAPIFKDSARKYTQLRHQARLLQSLALERASTEQLAVEVERLGDSYQGIVAGDEPMPNRFFKRASNRIKTGVTD